MIYKSKSKLNRNPQFEHSIKVTILGTKYYRAQYKEHGTWIVESTPFRTRAAAEARGFELQAEADARAAEETARIKAELAEMEREALQKKVDLVSTEYAI